MARIKHKFREWGARYIPAEIAGTLTALAAALSVRYLTGEAVLAAIAGTWGENIGYYSFIAASDVAKSMQHHARNAQHYSVRSFFRTLRDLVVEFGPAELFDTFLIRPFWMYLMPVILGNFPAGIIAGKLLADVTFYGMAIVCYECRKKWFR